MSPELGPASNAQSAPTYAVSCETAERLACFVRLLLHWNQRINLVARADESEIWHRHVGDSLQLMPHVRGVPAAIDLGSGAGFPGLVLSLASATPFSLVEADQRRAAFLREAVRQTAAPAEVVCGRAEQLQLRPTDVVTARGLAAVDRVIALASPFLASGGRLLLLKGRGVDQELAGAARKWEFHAKRLQSATSTLGSVLILSEITRRADQ